MNIIEYGKNELMKFIIILIVIFNKEWSIQICLCLFTVIDILYYIYFYTPPQRSCRGVYWFHHVRPSVDKSYVVR